MLGFGLGGPDFLLTPQQRRWREEARRAQIERERELYPAVDFEGAKMPPPGELVRLRASTYAPENPLAEILSSEGEKSPEGRYSYSLPILPAETRLNVPVRHDREPARVAWDGPVAIPRLCEGPQVWMSLTPAEIWSQRSGIAAARDTTVVGGLGMGWQLAQIAKRKERGVVKRLVVVEKSRELIDWYGETLCAQLGVDQLIHGDVWDAFEPYRDDMDSTRFVLDVWPGWFDSRYDRALRKRRKEGWRVWAWGSPRG